MRRKIQIKLAPVLALALLLCACTGPSSQEAARENKDLAAAFTDAAGAQRDEDGRLLFYQPTVDFEEAYPGAVWEQLAVSPMEPDVWISSETGTATELELAAVELRSVFARENDLYYVKSGTPLPGGDNPVCEIWSYNIPRKIEEKLFSADEAIAALGIADGKRPTQATNMDPGPDGVNYNTPLTLHGIFGEKLIFSVGFESHLCSYDLETGEFSVLYVFSSDTAYQRDVVMAYRDNALYFQEFLDGGQRENPMQIIKYDFTAGTASKEAVGPWAYAPFAWESGTGYVCYDDTSADRSLALAGEESLFEMPTMSFNALTASEGQLAVLVNLSEQTLDEIRQAQGAEAMEHTPSSDSIVAHGVALVENEAYIPLISDLGASSLTRVDTDGTNVYWSAGTWSLYEVGRGALPISYYDGALGKIVIAGRLGGYWDQWSVTASENYIVVTVEDGFFAVKKQALDRIRNQ